MKILSHRGFHQNCPENTLEAFEAAIALGVDGIETDIRITFDGIPIFYHNPQVPDGTNISDLTLHEIVHSVGYKVPRLEEILELTCNLDRSFCLNLELKTKDSFPVVMDRFREIKPTTAIAFTSFWHEGIVDLMREHPNSFDYGLIYASYPFGFGSKQWFESFPQINTLVFYQERLDQSLVDHCHQKNCQVWSYGDRTLTDRKKLHDFMVDGIISDRPDLWQVFS